MTAGDETPYEAARWFKEAEEELNTTLYLEKGEGIPLRSACFHAHLAAEKALKALLVSQEVDFPRTHDLVRLESMSLTDAQIDPDDLDLLDPWSMHGRYPGDLPEPTPAAARRPWTQQNGW
jgi:HEPN domain-containing protein